MVFLLLGAGSETTTHLISGSVYELTRTRRSAIGSRRIGAAPTWRLRSSCASSHPFNSLSLVSSGKILSSAGFG